MCVRKVEKISLLSVWKIMLNESIENGVLRPNGDRRPLTRNYFNLECLTRPNKGHSGRSSHDVTAVKVTVRPLE